jgi:hypothetical protein
MASSEMWNAFQLFKNGFSSSMHYPSGSLKSDLRMIQKLILKHADLDAKGLKKFLVDRGWVSCPHQGFHSHTIISPCGEYVLRIGRLGGNEAYACHAALAMQEGDNPYYQKVYWHCASLNGKCTYTLMERLYDVEGGENVLHRAEIVRCLPHGDQSVNYKNIFDSNNSMLRIALQKIESLIEVFGFKSDISQENIMQREDGQLVIIDSVYGSIH